VATQIEDIECITKEQAQIVLELVVILILNVVRALPSEFESDELVRHDEQFHQQGHIVE